MATERKLVLDAFMAKENKAASSTSRSSALDPPPKRRRIVRVGSSSEGEKDVGSAVVAGNVEEVPHDRAILSPPPPVNLPTGVNDVDGAENIGTNRSPVVDSEINKISEFDQPADRPVALFSPQPYIPQENKLVTIEYFALADSHDGFILATSIIPHQKKLKAIKTLDLESLSFQCLIAVSFFHSFLSVRQPLFSVLY